MFSFRRSIRVVRLILLWLSKIIRSSWPSGAHGHGTLVFFVTYTYFSLDFAPLFCAVDIYCAYMYKA